MKAKELAAMILADRDEHSCLRVVQGLIKEAAALAQERRSDAAKIAVFRESFQKWRAVCSILAGGTEGEKAGVSLYPKAMQLVSKPLFMVCAHGGAFLSYELDDDDRAVCAEVVDGMLAKERERVAQERFNLLFGYMMKRVFA